MISIPLGRGREHEKELINRELQSTRLRKCVYTKSYELYYYEVPISTLYIANVIPYAQACPHKLHHPVLRRYDIILCNVG
jgi:hypothetical protein